MSKLTPQDSPVVIPPMKDAELGKLITEQYKRACNAMPEILRFGAMMMRLEEKLLHDGVVSKGGRGNKGGLNHWLRTHAPEIAESTAYRFRDVTLGIAVDYEQIVGKSVAKQFALADLVTAEAKALPEPVRKKQQALFDYVSGTSQKSWLDKIKPPTAGDGRRNNKGGFQPNAIWLRRWLEENYADHPEYLDLNFCDLPKEIQARYLKEGRRYEERLPKETKEALQHAADARAWCEQITPALTLGIDKEYFLHLSAAQHPELIAALKDLSAAVAKMAKPTAPKALPAK